MKNGVSDVSKMFCLFPRMLQWTKVLLIPSPFFVNFVLLLFDEGAYMLSYTTVYNPVA